MPLELTAQPRRDDNRERPARRTRLLATEAAPNDRDRVLFTERLALLLETGVSLNQALAALHTQSDKPAVAQIIQTLLEDINAGRTFSAARVVSVIKARSPGVDGAWRPNSASNPSS